MIAAVSIIISCLSIGTAGASVYYARRAGQAYKRAAASAERAEQRRAVTVQGVTEGLTVGPDDVLVLTLPQAWDDRQLTAVVDRLADALRPDQYIVISGQAYIHKTTKPVDGHPALEGVIDG